MNLLEILLRIWMPSLDTYWTSLFPRYTAWGLDRLMMGLALTPWFAYAYLLALLLCLVREEMVCCAGILSGEAASPRKKWFQHTSAKALFLWTGVWLLLHLLQELGLARCQTPMDN